MKSYKYTCNVSGVEFKDSPTTIELNRAALDMIVSGESVIVRDVSNDAPAIVIRMLRDENDKN